MATLYSSLSDSLNQFLHGINDSQTLTYVEDYGGHDPKLKTQRFFFSDGPALTIFALATVLSP